MQSSGRREVIPGECEKIGAIPVRNLWLLMLYASPLFRELDSAHVAEEDKPDEHPDI